MSEVIGKLEILPRGKNFRTSTGISPEDLSHDSVRILDFLRVNSSSPSFARISDWLQHDGLLLSHSVGNYADFSAIARDVQLLENEMPEDTYVRIGVLTQDRKSYFRLFSNIEDLQNPLRAEYDLTLEHGAAVEFERNVEPTLKAKLVQQESVEYYRGISK